jgi:hypothetical protein
MISSSHIGNLKNMPSLKEDKKEELSYLEDIEFE